MTAQDWRDLEQGLNQLNCALYQVCNWESEMYFAKYIKLFSIFFLITSCAGSYTHRSGNNSNLSYDSRLCNAHARVVAPTYICKNPLMCAPEETSIALDALFNNVAAYDLCMLQRVIKK